MRSVVIPQRGATEPESSDVCPECHGRGWKVVLDGESAGTAVRCDCKMRGRSAEYLERSGIPERYRGCQLSNFHTGSKDPAVGGFLVRAKKISERYVDTFFDAKERRFRESGLIYIGPPGVGKTHLASAVLAELITRYGVCGRFVDFTTLIHRIQSTFEPTSPESKHQILDPVIDAEVLVLDELGAQKPRDWVMDTLYLIMNTRYTRRLPTIFTTNYRLESSAQGKDAKAPDDFGHLSARISPLLVSRLFQMAQPIQLADYDYRRNVKVHQHRIGR